VVLPGTESLRDSTRLILTSQYVCSGKLNVKIADVSSTNSNNEYYVLLNTVVDITFVLGLLDSRNDDSIF
jgi:hypothetical protein